MENLGENLKIKEPKLIRNWAELKEETSETHTLEIDIRHGNGWLTSKDGSDSYYLSTHTFYSHNYEYETLVLQACGFNVILANWDELNK